MKASIFFIDPILQGNRPALIGQMEKISPLPFSRVATPPPLHSRVQGRLGSDAVPMHLRPTAPIAADAVLVGDPGRALLLAQELLTEPKMSNHARGLWGYSGRTPAGSELTIQATGIGGPSAALVLSDLAELGTRRLVRVGTCAGAAGARQLGELLLVSEAVAAGGSATSLGVAVGEAIAPDPDLTERLGEALGDGRPAVIASVDSHPSERLLLPGVIAADMQTAPLLARARSLGIAAAAVLIVTETVGGKTVLEKDALELAEKLAGRAASTILSA
jgi:uridine phosphorylase